MVNYEEGLLGTVIAIGILMFMNFAILWYIFIVNIPLFHLWMSNFNSNISILLGMVFLLSVIVTLYIIYYAVIMHIGFIRSSIL